MQFFKVAFFYRASGIKKSKYCCHPPFHPPIFRRNSLKLLSPTLPILMNWILLSPPPLSSDPDNPPKIGTCTRSQIKFVILVIFLSLLHLRFPSSILIKKFFRGTLRTSQILGWIRPWFWGGVCHLQDQTELNIPLQTQLKTVQRSIHSIHPSVHQSVSFFI